MKPQIFLTSNLKNVLVDLLTHLSGQKEVVALITTATENQPHTEYYEQDKKAIQDRAHLSTFEYTLTGKSKRQVKKDLAEIDILYIAGGNVFHLLLAAQKCGFGEFVQEHLARGKIYIGQSAGSILAGPDTFPLRRTDLLSQVDSVNDYRGLDIVEYVVLPHWGREDKRETYHGERFEHTFNEDYKYMPLSDYQYAVFTGDKVSVIDVK